jgi:ParB-like chromosome segregation protein Spo0J
MSGTYTRQQLQRTIARLRTLAPRATCYETVGSESSGTYWMSEEYSLTPDGHDRLGQYGRAVCHNRHRYPNEEEAIDAVTGRNIDRIDRILNLEWFNSRGKRRAEYPREMSSVLSEPPATELPFHPAADRFPLLEGEEFDALVADIAANGLRESILLHPDGSILDGRNRLRACQQAGVAPRFEPWDGQGSEEAVVLSLNLHRRHLTPEQRRAVVLTLRGQGQSERQIAAALQTSPATVHRDLATASDEAVALPERITGRDGKSRPAVRTNLAPEVSRETTEDTVPPLESEEEETEEKAPSDAAGVSYAVICSELSTAHHHMLVAFSERLAPFDAGQRASLRNAIAEHRRLLEAMDDAIGGEYNPESSDNPRLFEAKLVP